MPVLSTPQQTYYPFVSKGAHKKKTFIRRCAASINNAATHRPNSPRIKHGGIGAATNAHIVYRLCSSSPGPDSVILFFLALTNLEASTLDNIFVVKGGQKEVLLQHTNSCTLRCNCHGMYRNPRGVWGFCRTPPNSNVLSWHPTAPPGESNFDAKDNTLLRYFNVPPGTMTTQRSPRGNSLDLNDEPFCFGVAEQLYQHE